jgi:hypothetical protein
MVQIVIYFGTADGEKPADFARSSSTVALHDPGHLPRAGDKIRLRGSRVSCPQFGLVEEVIWTADAVPCPREFLVGDEGDQGVPVTFCRRVEVRCRALPS